MARSPDEALRFAFAAGRASFACSGEQFMSMTCANREPTADGSVSN
jgi:hypothetical protein